MKTYAIAGVSGHTGKVAAESLLAHKAKVRVIVRDANKGSEWQAKGAEVAVADLGDTAALTKALHGVDGAYLLVPPNMVAEDPALAQRNVAKHLAAAVKAAGVDHIVYLSSIGAQHASGTGPIVVAHYAEDIVGKAAKNVSFIRAAYFMENLAGSFAALAHGIYPTFLPKDFALSMVATRDIGKLAASLLSEGGKGIQVVELGAKKKYAMSDVAAIATKILAKPIAVQEGPLSAMAETLQGYGFTPKLAQLYVEMSEGIISGRVDFEGKGRHVDAPTSLEEFLGEALPR